MLLRHFKLLTENDEFFFLFLASSRLIFFFLIISKHIFALKKTEKKPSAKVSEEKGELKL